jgi:hypothetical protein
MEGNVESEFLYSTLLSTDLVPFSHLPPRNVVLPILWKSDGYKMLNATEARKEGYLGLAEWLEKCEIIWKQKRGDKAERETIYSWLDYRKKLTQQRRKKYTVLHPMSATYLCAGVVGADSTAALDSDLSAAKFLADYKLFFLDTDSQEEAQYLSAVLNSPAVDQAIKPLQSRGDFGPRDICMKIWALPIPTYDATNSAHKNLAALGTECSRASEIFMESLPTKTRAGSLGRLRTMIRENLRDPISEIDSIVRDILQ